MSHSLTLDQLKEQESVDKHVVSLARRENHPTLPSLPQELLDAIDARPNESKTPSVSAAMVKNNPKHLHTVILQSNVILTQHDQELNGTGPIDLVHDETSAMLYRLNHAFRGGAIPQLKRDSFNNWTEDDARLPFIYIHDMMQYVMAGIYFDVPKAQGLRCIGLLPTIDFPIANAPQVPAATMTCELITSTLTTLTLDRVDASVKMREGSRILGYEIERCSSGRANENTWKRCGRKKIEPYDAIAFGHDTALTLVKTHVVWGLTSDMGYRFRIRSRNAGGWGPFSLPSELFSTRSSIAGSCRRNIYHAAQTFRFKGVVTLMKGSPTHGLLQRVGCEQLAKMLITTRWRVHEAEEALHEQVLSVVLGALTTFDADAALVQAGALVLARMLRHDSIRQALPTPLRQVINRRLVALLETFPLAHVQALHTTLTWALRLLHAPWCPRVIGLNEAAMRIQGLFKTQRARSLLSLLRSESFVNLVTYAHEEEEDERVCVR